MSEFYTNIWPCGNKLYVRGYRNGTKFTDEVKYQPHLYVNAKRAVDESEQWTAFVTNQKVERIDFEDIKSAKEFVERYKDVSGFNIFGQTSYTSQYISSKWTKEVKYNPKIIDSMVIDIETETEAGFPNIRTANEKITLITCKRKGRKAVTFAWKPVEGPALDCEYRLHKSEESMLVGFIEWFSKNPPDVITGWNIEGFDIPYMCVRIFNILGEEHLKSLSPHRRVFSKEVEILNRKELRFEIVGISILDYLPLYRKFTFTTRESYKLDFICMEELRVGKLDHSEFNTFKEFYEGNWHKFVEYNIIDCQRVEDLDNKLGLLNLVYEVAYLAKVNYVDCFSPIKTWEAYIYNALLLKKIAIPIKTRHNTREPFGGGHVKDTLSGFYKWIVTFDLTSLYPHIIMLLNISPECILNGNKAINIDDIVKRKIDLTELVEQDVAMAGNGQFFRRDITGVFPELMSDLFHIRKSAKDTAKSMDAQGGDKAIIDALNVKEKAIKVLLNSLFGAAGNPYFRYYDLRMAEGITMTGQIIIQWIERKVNEYMNKVLKTEDFDYVVASDTDSIMVNFGPFIEEVCPNKDTQEVVKFLDKICGKQFGDFIHNSLDELSTYLNAKEHALHMKRENICDRGVFLKKKRYILNVWNSEGKQYDEPKAKVMGIELVKSSTPGVVRNALREAIPIIMYKSEDDIKLYVKVTKAKFFADTVENISFPRGVNEIEKWMSSSSLYISRTPINTRAAILHNHLVKTLKLEDKYPLIKGGDKIKYVYLKLPNTLKENVIGFIGELPVEFGLHKYIDYETQFNSAFMDSLEAMVLPLKWQLVNRSSFAKFGI